MSMTFEPAFLDLNRWRTARDTPAVRDALSPAIATLAAAHTGLPHNPPSTVCDKTILPPSGDMHDFASIPTYYWPNPATESGLPWVRRDGYVNPTVRVTDVGRFFRLVNTAEILTLHAWYCNDDRAAQQVVRLVRAWFLDPATCMNASLEYAQLVPGAASGSHWGLIDFQRSYLLLDLLAVVSSCGAPLPAAQLEELRVWFLALRDWLLAAEHGREERLQPGNHGTWYDVQVVAYSLFVGDEHVARLWLETVTRPRMMAQIAADGSQPQELSRATPIEYVVFNLYGLVILAEFAARVGVDLWGRIGDSCPIERAIDWLLPYLRGELSIGRTTKHHGTFTMAAETAMILRIAADRLDRADYRATLESFVLHRASSRVNLLLPPRSGHPSTPVPEPVPTTRHHPATRPFPGSQSVPEKVVAYAKAFIVGCPRSGTVWTRDILQSHPLTVVGPESHLFGRVYRPFVDPGSDELRRRRTLEAFDDSAALLGKERGPQHWIDRDTLEQAMRADGDREHVGSAIIGAAFDKYFLEHGGASGRMLVEKTPGHLYWAETILADWPEAKIVEVLRDGRDVVASLGYMTWAPAERRDQIQQWVSAVSCGLRVRETSAAAGRWHTLRFEALKADPRTEIVRLYNFLELPWDDDLVDEIVIETEFERMQQTRKDFTHRRRGQVGDWHTELSPEDVALFTELAGATLKAAGY